MCDFYQLLKPFFFMLEPETAHAVALRFLACTPRFMLPKPVSDPVTYMGIEFPNRVGLAAGFDKDAHYLSALAKLGFGFIEVGTTTPKPQVGNPLPRIIRIKEQNSLINRMGFNNRGVDYLVEQLKNTSYRGVLGINIGKNRDTPLEQSVDDYLICLKKVYPYASYITINISSPNTPGLRELQQADALKQLLLPLKQQQAECHKQTGRYVPLAIKLSPDETPETLAAIVEVVRACGIEGVITTNTTLDHSGIVNETLAQEVGGASGQVITEKANAQLKELHRLFANDPQHPVTLVGVGGIMSVVDAQNRLAAGADLLQVYSGFIYGGPWWLADLIQRLSKAR